MSDIIALIASYEMSHLGKAVYHHKDGVFALLSLR